MIVNEAPSVINDAIQNLTQKIDFDQQVHKGQNGYVLTGTNKVLDRGVVVKFYYWNKGAHPEPQRLSKLAHDSILTVDDASPISDDWAFFITRHCQHGDLDDYLDSNALGPLQALNILQSIASGVSYLNSNGFLHRDLKPSNIFVEADGQPLIGDFGSIANIGNDGFAETMTKHALLYRPPECCSSHRSYPESDVYQLGIIFYQLLGGALPYQERQWLNAAELKKYDALSGFEKQQVANEAIQKRIISGKLLDIASLPPWVCGKTKRFIRKATNKLQSRRFQNAAELIAAAHHLRKDLLDWRITGDYLTLDQGGRMFRINKTAAFLVEKKVTSDWRKAYNPIPNDLDSSVSFVLSQVQ